MFVVEQDCPYPELDGRDTEPGTSHLWTTDELGPTAYLRVLDDGGHWRIGRVCTRGDARGQALAGHLMDAAIQRSADRPIVLDAQSHFGVLVRAVRLPGQRRRLRRGRHRAPTHDPSRLAESARPARYGRSMCFSPQADLVGGVVIGIIGFDVVRNVHQRRDHLAFAALPLLFAAHQLTETFVWWGLQGHVDSTVGRIATWLYLLFAFVVLPTYVPLAIRALEPVGRRRNTMNGFVALGAVVSTLLLAAMIRGPISAHLADDHIRYSIKLHAGLVIVVAYVVATCASAIFSGYRHIAIFGVVNLIAVAVIARLTIDGFASVWCGWAALTSVAIALHIRFGRPHTTVVAALA